MAKLGIQEKSNLRRKLYDETHFSADLALFQEKFPKSDLNNELARANKFNKEKLHNRMLHDLLDVVTEADILTNRGLEATSKPAVSDKPDTLKAPGKPKAPKAPGKPKTPKAPKAPGKPKAPKAPKALPTPDAIPTDVSVEDKKKEVNE